MYLLKNERDRRPREEVVLIVDARCKVLASSGPATGLFEGLFEGEALAPEVRRAVIRAGDRGGTHLISGDIGVEVVPLLGRGPGPAVRAVVLHRVRVRSSDREPTFRS